MEGIMKKNKGYAPRCGDVSRIHSDEGRMVLV